MHEKYKIKHFTFEKYATSDEGVPFLSWQKNNKSLYLFQLTNFILE